MAEGQANISRDVMRFWEDLIVKFYNSKKKGTAFDLNRDRDLWLQTWRAAAMCALGDICTRQGHVILAAIYLELPLTTAAHPDALSVVKTLNILLTFVGTRTKQAGGGGGGGRVKRGGHKVANTYFIDDFLSLNIIVDVVEKRLLASLEMVTSPVAVLQEFEMLKTQLQTKAIQSITDAAALGAFLMRFKVMDTYTDSLSRVTNDDFDINVGAIASRKDQASNQGERPWEGWWVKPTVGWLLMGDYLVDVPNLGCPQETTDLYAQTLLRVWTKLTFYWGTAAIFPKCMRKGGDRSEICGEPLLDCCTGGGSRKVITCSMCIVKRGSGHREICGKAAAWRCHRHNHDAICLSCLRNRQRSLLGFDSTDVYDCVVDRDSVRHEGTVFYLSRMRSRRPPRVDPNWHTSYRLQTSVLVAVVRLGMAGEHLCVEQAIQWAEIVPMDPRNQHLESQARTDGRMALRLLSRADCSVLDPDADSPFEPGTHLAVIDLRVFVPEVVSVLNTFSNALFPAHLMKIPFAKRLIGSGAAPPANTISVCHHDSDDSSKVGVDIRGSIMTAIETSEIDIIRRLSTVIQHRIVNAICNLRPVRTLYGTQLHAFINGLNSAVHCTQGPPGTGKSYVGVCLVLALMIIRMAAVEEGLGAVGPIVMLSYKNHAL
jgi:hypothetical protein